MKITPTQFSLKKGQARNVCALLLHSIPSLQCRRIWVIECSVSELSRLAAILDYENGGGLGRN